MRNDEDDLSLVLFQDALENRFDIVDIVGIDRQVEGISDCLRGFLASPQRGGIDDIDTANYIGVDELSRQFGCTPLASLTQAGIASRGRRFFGMTDEYDRGGGLGLEEPREADRNRRVDDDDLDSSAPALAAPILIRHVVAHGTRLYVVFRGLTMPDQPWRPS
jgi:hypothetical protein